MKKKPAQGDELTALKQQMAQLSAQLAQLQQAGGGLPAPPVVIQKQEAFAQPKPTQRKSLGQACSIYGQHLPQNLPPKTRKIKLAALTEFRDWIGRDKPLPKIARDDLARFANFLVFERKNSQRTAFFKFTYLGQFFDLMIDWGLYPMANPAKRIVRYGTRQKARDTEANKHRPFRDDELKNIFDPETYPAHNPHLFFGIMLGYYTGARVNEIAQLLLVNVDTKKKVIHIRSHAATGGSLKTVSSSRDIPIHPDLIRAGLFDYVQELRQAKQFRLFPHLKKGVNNYGGRLGSDFGRHLLKIGIKRDPKKEDRNKFEYGEYKERMGIGKSFHSLRNNFSEMCDAGGIDLVTSSHLLGHKQNTMIQQHYMTTKGISLSADAIAPRLFPVIVPRLGGIKYRQGMFAGFFARKLGH